MCFFYGCQNKQRSFPCAAFSDFYSGGSACVCRAMVTESSTIGRYYSLWPCHGSCG